MNYLLGKYEPTLLPNFQLALPAKIRRSLRGGTLILSTGFDTCLFGFDLPSWEKIIQPGLAKEIFTSEGRQIRRQIFASAEEVRTDGQGRLGIPESLRTFAGIEIGDELVVIGAGDHFEIWKKEKWQETITYQSF